MDSTSKLLSDYVLWVYSVRLQVGKKKLRSWFCNASTDLKVSEVFWSRSVPDRLDRLAIESTAEPSLVAWGDDNDDGTSRLRLQSEAHASERKLDCT